MRLSALTCALVPVTFLACTGGSDPGDARPSGRDAATDAARPMDGSSPADTGRLPGDATAAPDAYPDAGAVDSGVLDAGGDAGSACVTDDDCASPGICQGDRCVLDSDGDRVPDVDERDCGSDPTDASSVPDPNAFGGSGTLEDPYLLCAVSQLSLLSADDALLSAHFRVTRDLGRGTATALVPAGSAATPFTGDFDGGGHVISSVSFTDGAASDVGLFAFVGSGAEIHDLTLDGWMALGNGTVGLLAGTNEGTLQNVTITNGLLTSTHHSGLLVGENAGTIAGARVSGEITSGNHVGGVVGRNDGTVRDSESTAQVSAGNRVGGLVGSHTGVVERSFSTSRVEGAFSVGGLIGTMFSGAVRDSYSQCALVRVDPPAGAATADAGGLVGTAAERGPTTIDRSYASCEVVVLTLSDRGGLVGNTLGDLTVTSSYYNQDVTPGGPSGAGTGVSMAALQDQATFVGWDFTSTWTFDTPLSIYPVLAWQ